MCLDFHHSEACAVFVAETACVAGLDQCQTSRDAEWTHDSLYLNPFVVYKMGDTSLSSVNVVFVKGEGKVSSSGARLWMASCLRLRF